MKIKEATFIFERFNGGRSTAPFLLIDEIDKIELCSYLLKSDKEAFNQTEQQRAEILLIEKIEEYETDIERSRDFISKYFRDEKEKEAVEKIEGVNITLEYLTDLVLLLAKIGHFEDPSVYEAHRIYILNYRNQLKEAVENYLELIKGKNEDIYNNQKEFYESQKSELQFIDILEQYVDKLKDEYEALKTEE